MKFTLILIMLFSLFIPAEDREMIKIRNLYEQAALGERAQLKLSDLLANSDDENPLLTGYKGASLMLGANYAFSPLSKFSKFNKGKRLIEKALGEEPKNLELRYVRFTIQTNLPKFLGYSNNINRDKNFIISQLELTTDVDLRERMVSYLLTSKLCTESELKRILEWKNK